MKLLIVEDDRDLGNILKEHFQDRGNEVLLAGNGVEALNQLERQDFDVVLLDLLLPDVNGMDLLDRIKSFKGSEVVILTGHGTIRIGVEAVKRGAYDFLTKPCTLSEIESAVEKAYKSLILKKGDRTLKREKTMQSEELIFKSKKMKEVIDKVYRISCSDCPVLLVGETGVGKEMVARFIHSVSERSSKPFVVINVTSIPKDLFEAELFGYEKGAFTGANAPREGFFELSNGGTLVLDEIGELDISVQTKLLRAIETKTFYRVGGRKEIRSDVRIIGTTNKNIKELVKEGKFREDLYFRLNTFELYIPSLIERKEDIIPLAEYFLKLCSAKYSKNVKGFTKEAIEKLLSYNYPGNVRELKNIVERAYLLCDDEYIDDVQIELLGSKGRKTLRELEKEKIKEVLKEVNYNKRLASEKLGIPLRTLYRKIEKYNIEAQGS